MRGIQLVGVFFGLFLMYLTFLYYKRREFTLNERMFWSFLSMGFILISLFPNVLDPILADIGVIRAMDLFIILGFMFLIGSVFYVYFTLRKTQKQMEEIIRKVALNYPKKKN